MGAFPKGMHELKKRNLIDVIINRINENKPFLGICLGMQLLFEESYEFEVSKGLGIFQDKVTNRKDHLKNSELKNSIKIPHMGWNNLTNSTGRCLYIKDKYFKENTFF